MCNVTYTICCCVSSRANAIFFSNRTRIASTSAPRCPMAMRRTRHTQMAEKPERNGRGPRPRDAFSIHTDIVHTHNHKHIGIHDSTRAPLALRALSNHSKRSTHHYNRLSCVVPFDGQPLATSTSDALMSTDMLNPTASAMRRRLRGCKACA